jgi:hypothetical protein
MGVGLELQQKHFPMHPEMSNKAFSARVITNVLKSLTKPFYPLPAKDIPGIVSTSLHNPKPIQLPAFLLHEFKGFRLNTKDSNSSYGERTRKGYRHSTKRDL